MKRIFCLLIIFLFLFPGIASSAEKIKVAYASITGNRIPMWIAEEMNLYRKNGIDVQLIFIDSSGRAMPALIAGEVSVLAGAAAGAGQAIFQGIPLVIIGSFGPTPYKLMVHPSIQNIEALKGKKIAINKFGSSDFYAIKRTLRKLGLDPDKDVTLLQVGGVVERTTTVYSGAVSATITTPEIMRRFKTNLKELADLVDMGIYEVGSAIITHKNIAKTNPQMLESLMAAFTEAISIARKNKSLALKVYSKHLKTTDQDVLEFNYNIYILKTISKVPFFPVEAAKTIIEDLIYQDPRAKSLAINQIVDNRFLQKLIDTGFIDRLYK